MGFDIRHVGVGVATGFVIGAGLANPFTRALTARILWGIIRVTATRVLPIAGRVALSIARVAGKAAVRGVIRGVPILARVLRPAAVPTARAALAFGPGIALFTVAAGIKGAISSIVKNRTAVGAISAGFGQAVNTLTLGLIPASAATKFFRFISPVPF